MKPHETGTDNPIDFPKQMNANELADELDTTGRLYNWAKKAQAMLRQFALAESIIKQKEIEIRGLTELLRQAQEK